MPTHWKKEFRKHGNKLSAQSNDELAQYFDIFHNESPNTSHTARNFHASTHNNNNQRSTNNNNYNYNGSNTNPNSIFPRLKPEGVCPIHGGRKWHYCIFNKDGPNYRPPARNTTTTTSRKKSNDNFNDDQTRHETNDDDNTSTNPYDDDFKSVAPPNEPVPQVITEGISTASDRIFTFMNYLFDSGGTKSHIPLSRLPKSLTKHQSPQPYSALSSSGVHQHHEYITLSKICFRQFSTNIWLENVELIIFDDSKHCAYDIILGRKIIQQFGFIIHFAKNETSCLNVTLPFLQRMTKPSTDPITVQNFINDTLTATTSTNLTHDQFSS